jgi:NAD(P)H-nitrite reductase large subunit
MTGNYKVITLCGSTKFRDEFLAVQKRLTLEGNIVISVGLFGHSGDEEVWLESTKEMLDDMHLRKIDLADEIFVINKGGYIGESTKNEIDYAIKNGKGINYLEPVE